MKNNKLIIMVLIILIITIIFQLLFFTYIKKKNTLAQNEIVTVKNDTSGIIYNINDLFRYYSEITVSTKQMEETVDDLITNKFIKIRNDTINNTPSQNLEYYSQHKKEIDEIGILTSIDFMMIAEQLKNTLKDENLMPREINIKVNENEIDNNEYYKFDLIITYVNTAKINLKCLVKKQNSAKGITTSKIDNKIYYQSNSNLDAVFRNYKGTLNQENFIQTLNSLIDGLQQIYRDNKLTSLNNQAQYYSLNMPWLNGIGIYSDADLQNIISKITNNINWNDQTDFIYYDVNPQSYKEKDGYITFEIIFVFSQFEEFKITAEIAPNDIEPNVRFTGGEKE